MFYSAIAVQLGTWSNLPPSEQPGAPPTRGTVISPFAQGSGWSIGCFTGPWRPAAPPLPPHGSASWRQQERREGKWRKKLSWYRGSGDFTSVMFCPQKPGEELARRWREVEARGAASRGWRFEVLELGGRKISSMLCGNLRGRPLQQAGLLGLKDRIPRCLWEARVHL